MQNLFPEYRLRVLFLSLFVVTLMIISKLFYLQVFQYDEYLNLALKNQQGYKKIGALRGQILLQDYHSGEDFKLATNTTYDTLFADPSMLDEPTRVAEIIAPLIFDKEAALELENDRILELKAQLDETEFDDVEQAFVIKPKSLNELELEFKNQLIAKMSKKLRDKVVLVNKPSKKLVLELRSLKLSALEVNEDAVSVYPSQVVDAREYAKLLSPRLDISLKTLMSSLRGSNKYTVLAKKLEPEVVSKLKEIFKKDKDLFFGVGFQSESYRFYPEGELLAQVVGYTNVEGGQYGLEKDFDELLKGEDGLFKAKIDGLGKQVTVDSDTLINPAKDGSDIYLTMDRSIQLYVERILKEDTENFQADSGQVIVMNPNTGAILAMANYPTFDPNKFFEALDKKEFEPPKIEVQDPEFPDDPERKVLVDDENYQDKIFVEKEYGQVKTYFYEDLDTYKRVELLPVYDENEKFKFYEVYKNTVGASVFRNKVVFDAYEPGSVFKPITMAAAINSELIEPETTVNDDGPIKVDEFKINNALNEHYGVIDMTRVLETSNNIGMAFVARTMGRRLFFDYIKKFGFSKPTGIEVKNEREGIVKSHLRWAESELVTHAFGQGLTVTPIQMVSAFSAVVNNGVLMKPYMIDKIVDSKGSESKTEPEVLRRVISKKTADQLKIMLQSVVENGQAKAARVSGYTVGGKTGTAQTYKDGKPLSGPGTTITNFLGFAPVENPEFVVMVKYDKPRSSEWASGTSIYTFNKIADFLLDYLGVVPNNL
jgi:stage V sporulation protein D (sporulation-specific penicillin-binding protein)